MATVEDLRRILEIVVLDTLGLENSVARSRTLIAAVGVGVKLHEVGELEDRVESLEHALEQRRDDPLDGEPWSSHAD